MFKTYPKIHRLGKDETIGILSGTCVIQEKLDGANASIWLEGGVIKVGKRNSEITDTFRGFPEYAKANLFIKLFLEEHPNCRLFGEWLIKHTVPYNKTAYGKFYLFDIYDDINESWYSPKEVNEVVIKYGFLTPQTFAILENPTEEEIIPFVGKTNLGKFGEGVVIKNEDFVNQFGDRCYAKLVTKEFKEKNKEVFGGNDKHSDTYWETYIMEKYATIARVNKVMDKISMTIDRKLDLPDTSRVTSTCYHDLITEEIWEIQSKVQKVDFKNLKRICIGKFTTIYKDILSGDTDRVVYN